MSCIRVKVFKAIYDSITNVAITLLRQPCTAKIYRKSEISLKVSLLASALSASITLVPRAIKCAITEFVECFKASITDAAPHPVVKMGIVCSIDNQPILPEGISWSEDILSWDSSEGGVIKYNLLTSSGVWRIEELL